MSMSTELLTNRNNHSSNDAGIHAVVDQSLLITLEESLDGSLDLLLHGGVQRLGGGHAADDLTSVGGHQGAEGGNHSIKISNSVVFCKGKKKILCKVIESKFLGSSSETINLEASLDCGVQ